MTLTLLSMLGGGLMRLLPEVFGWLNKKTDYSHELAMMDKQREMYQFQAQAQMEVTRYQGEVDMTVAALDAQKTALRSQMKLTGMWFVDALNMLVRPLTTYYMLALYGLAKTAMYVVAVKSGLDGWEAVLKIYTPTDMNMLGGILGFWFVNRTFQKKV